MKYPYLDPTSRVCDVIGRGCSFPGDSKVQKENQCSKSFHSDIELKRGESLSSQVRCREALFNRKYIFGIINALA